MHPPKDSSPFLQNVREAIRVRHLSIRTNQVYVHCAKRFILFNGKHTKRPHCVPLCSFGRL